MRAVVYRGPNDLRLEIVPVPRISSQELLVKVTVCGVCPTDIKKIQYGTVPPPRIFGHETAGIIVRCGVGVRGFQVGDRVALHHHVPCLKCHACAHRAFAQCAQYKRTGITAGFEPAGGGYAEYVRVMPWVLPGVIKIPHRNSFLEGAMLEPVNTVLKAVKRLALLHGDTVLVAGQRPIGLMFTSLLDLQGMRVLATDLFASRLQLARKSGAKWTWLVNSERRRLLGRARLSSARRARITQGGRAVVQTRPAAKESLVDLTSHLTRGRGLDAAIIAVPSDEVVREAQQLVRGGGQVLLFSHTRRGDLSPVDLATICTDEKDLIGSYSADFTLQSEVARLVFSRKLDVRNLITHQFPLDQTADAIALAAKPTQSSLKVVVSQLEQ